MLGKRTIDMRDKRFGYLEVINYIGVNLYGQAVWECRCDCGRGVEKSTSHLRGGAKSCGCRSRSYKHGMSNTRIWNVYMRILQRCGDENSPDYKNYGGRGIKCRWETFKDFYKDMEEGYSDDLTIERINNGGDYCKGNCKWATKEEQANNTRRNVYLLYNGEIMSVAQWARKMNMNYWTLRQRIKRGWSPERALTTPEYNRGQK